LEDVFPIFEKLIAYPGGWEEGRALRQLRKWGQIWGGISIWGIITRFIAKMLFLPGQSKNFVFWSIHPTILPRFTTLIENEKISHPSKDFFVQKAEQFHAELFDFFETFSGYAPV
jgi:hypothetical protein